MRIKVVHFVLSESYGGIESFLYEMYRRNDDNNLEMEFVAMGYDNSIADRFRKIGAIVQNVSNRDNFKAYKRDIEKLMSTYKSECDRTQVVMHFHKNSAADMTAIKIAKRSGFKIIVHSHNTAPSTGYFTKVLHLLNRSKLNQYADYKAACSKMAADWMFGKNQDVKIIYNGIDTKRFFKCDSKRKQIRQELGIPKDSTVIINVGRFTKQKNQNWLIDMMTHTKEKNIYLILVGDGELREHCQKEAKEKDIAERVKFLGQRQDIPDLLNASDIFMMPSIYEGYPISALEAQACGLKVMLSDTISKEVDVTGNIKWFSLKEDYDKVISQILENKWQCQKIVREYDIETTYNNLKNMYQEIVE